MARRVHTTVAMPGGDISLVQRVIAVFWGCTESRYQGGILFQYPALASTGRKLSHWNTDRLTSVTAGAVWSVNLLTTTPKARLNKLAVAVA